jgi:hypothetical protein
MIEFEKVVRLFNSSQIEYILIGGWAAILHGSVRTTVDSDFVYRRSSENSEKLVTALQPFSPYLRGAPPGLPFKFDKATIRNGLNFTLTTNGLGDLDLLGEVAGGGNYEALLPFTNEMNVMGLLVRCVDLETLIQLKRAAGRSKDFEALAELQTILANRKVQKENNS